jgi:Na+/H+-dicarboxylate symporter
LVIIVATCSMFGIPPEGIALILPIYYGPAKFFNCL